MLPAVTATLNDCLSRIATRKHPEFALCQAIDQDDLEWSFARRLRGETGAGSPGDDLRNCAGEVLTSAALRGEGEVFLGVLHMRVAGERARDCCGATDLAVTDHVLELWRCWRR
jgi:hypothetical protein